ncbi:MAG: acetate--CoA ligase family protein [Bacteroidales bacterium]|nr:acetate--CoA ligase family protein [Bacteroidales bacterium]
MINKQLVNPGSIAVIGGSNNLQKPGGKILKNIIDGNYKGGLYVVNLKEKEVQGFKVYQSVHDLPEAELAILAIPAKNCSGTIEILATTKNTKAFIVISAGFSEENTEGAQLEKELVEIVNRTNGCLIGPNCIGILNSNYHGVFTSPIPRLHPSGCDFVSGSGATAVFIFESALPKGLTFANVFSVGNSAQTGIEDVLEYWDDNFDPEHSSKIKLLYIEHIKDPDRLLRHASSLIRKGCKIAAIKAGRSDAGKRAALSHTGAIASADSAVEALFRKAGIVRCFGREELTTVASIFMYKEFKGKNIAIITHAGGPAVMLTDALSEGGMNIPEINGPAANELLAQLNPGASVSNPIDILATGNKEQLSKIIDYCENRFDNIDAMIVIFGSTGLTPVFETYKILHEKMLHCSKPIYPILPSISSAEKEVQYFLNEGHINFPDEVVLGRALTKIFNAPLPAEEKIFLENIDIPKIRSLIDSCDSGYMSPEKIKQLLEAANIPVVNEDIATTRRKALAIARETGYPLAIKVIGPVHKSDVGGVTLNIKSDHHLLAEFKRMMQIKGVTGVLIQKMETGTELFIGAKYEPRFGHVIICGLGGIFVEVLDDFSSGLAPLTFNEAYSMIKSLKSYRIIKGARGQQGVNEDKFAEIIVRLSSLLRFATEIKEIDLNPLIGNLDKITVVDARINIQKLKES